MLYEALIRPWLFGKDPEDAHYAVARLSRLAARVPLGAPLLRLRFNYEHPALETTVAGIDFPNPVGMAAGFDKSGDLYPFLSNVGLGFVESGTFTGLAQPGNPRPRIFRVPEIEGLINSMGFNNPGSEAAAAVLARQARRIPRGINIGKSKLAELEHATEDYLKSLRKLRDLGDYLCVNVSSPNTPGLRKLQDRGPLTELLGALLKELPPGMPLFLKVAPDLTDAAFDDLLGVTAELGLGGLVISNTTIDHSAVPEALRQAGGLSGAPVRKRSTDLLARAYRAFRGQPPVERPALIGVGGIFSGADALEKIEAGANLVQIYTGYIYRGPDLPRQINRALVARLKAVGCSLSELVGSGNPG